MKHCLRIGALIALCLLICLSGCGNRLDAPEVSDKSKQNLWIVTHNSGMKQLINTISDRFMEKYPDVTITVDTGPDDPDEWEAYYEQLRIQIMAGTGPDLFLFLSENVTSSSLLADVNQCMRNGLFLDISEYYDSDTELNKDGFVPAVMDAGVVDGARYVLPLRYNFPVVYADVQQLKVAGVSVDDLQNGMAGLVDAVQKMGDNALAAEFGSLYFYLYWMNFLPELIDYEEQEVTLNKTQLVEFLKAYRELMAAGVASAIPSFDGYVSQGDFWALDGHSIYLSTLNSLIENVRIAKAAGIELAVIPLTGADGTLIANVSYYGAISAGTSSPELAYAFVRELMKTENQWENNLDVRISDLIDHGWPVLTEGSWHDLDADLLEGLNNTSNTKEEKNRRGLLKNAPMLEEDYVILNTPIDEVKFFPTTQWDYMTIIDSQLNINANSDVSNTDLETLAEEIIQKLEWHLAEG